jgi:formamidopyrimidine-DNA glycosylase
LPEPQVPELPEVETMVRGIRPFVDGRRILSVVECPTRCRPVSMTPPFPDLARSISGQTVSSVRRLGKRVVLDLSDESNVVVEPRMTGLMLLADPPDVEHLRVEWKFAGRRQYNSIWFWDRRGLGTIRLYRPGELQQVYGPDTLGPDALAFTVDDWRTRLRRTSRPIKVALLDQKLVAGIGNLYASEILHVAGIDPKRPSEKLSKVQIARLSDATRLVLERAIETEGSTLGDGTYRNALSQSGRYQNEHRVYMKESLPCPTCSQGVIIRLVQAQRSTFYCPKCQR